jgi:hypothetical protein
VLLDLVVAVLVEILVLMETLVQQILVVAVEQEQVEADLQVLVMDKEEMVVQVLLFLECQDLHAQQLHQIQIR